MRVLALLVLFAATAHADPYQGIRYNTTTGQAFEHLSGAYSLAASTVSYSTYTIILNGVDGSVTATSFVGSGAALTGVIYSTAALQTQITAIAISTGVNTTAIAAIKLSTGAIQAELDAFEAQVAVDTTAIGVGFAAAGDFKWKISISSSCGSGWLRADGSSISTTTYSALFAELGYSFGGVGANFTLPDMNNGEFVRAVSTGTAGGNLTVGMGTKQMDAVISHTHGYTAQAAGDMGSSQPVPSSVGSQSLQTSGQTPSGATETRPRNYAMIPCIYTGVP